MVLSSFKTTPPAGDGVVYYAGVFSMLKLKIILNFSLSETQSGSDIEVFVNSGKG